MCVIIQRNEGVDIPFDKLALACKINKHGYGLSVADRGRLTTIRSIKTNDPEEVAKRLQDAKDHKVFLHLRHATVGEVNMENSHPFVLLRRKKDKVDMGIMHNGTLHEFKPTTGDDSDTKRFVETFVRPLVVHINRSVGPKEILKDALLYDIMSDYAKTLNKFIIYDGWGNHLIINEKEGKQFDGWWASNTYSFDETHWRAREGNASASASAFPGRSHWTPERGWEWDGDPLPLGDADLGRPAPASNSNQNRGSSPTGIQSTIRTSVRSGEAVSPVGQLLKTKAQEEYAIEVQTDCYSIGRRIERNGKMGEKMAVVHALLHKRDSFVKLAGIKSLDEVEQLTPENLESLCTSFPKGMAVLIMDLIQERRTRSRV